MGMQWEGHHQSFDSDLQRITRESSRNEEIVAGPAVIKCLESVLSAQGFRGRKAVLMPV